MNIATQQFIARLRTLERKCQAAKAILKHWEPHLHKDPGFGIVSTPSNEATWSMLDDCHRKMRNIRVMLEERSK